MSICDQRMSAVDVPSFVHPVSVNNLLEISSPPKLQGRIG